MDFKRIGVEFSEGDIVYLKTDPDQMPRQVTGYLLKGDRILYELTFSNAQQSYHSPLEMITEPNLDIFVVTE